MKIGCIFLLELITSLSFLLSIGSTSAINSEQLKRFKRQFLNQLGMNREPLRRPHQNIPHDLMQAYAHIERENTTDYTMRTYSSTGRTIATSHNIQKLLFQFNLSLQPAEERIIRRAELKLWITPRKHTLLNVDVLYRLSNGSFMYEVVKEISNPEAGVVSLNVIRAVTNELNNDDKLSLLTLCNTDMDPGSNTVLYENPCYSEAQLFIWAEDTIGNNIRRKRASAYQHYQQYYQDRDVRKRHCRKHPLEVEFKSIGWDSWILAPAKMNAGYCYGSCEYPFPHDVIADNHAVIQSIMYYASQHNDQRHNDPGAPCCIPVQLSPLTMLYFQKENGKDVVIKKYYDMTVDECGCA